jgi:hypothetical protein
LVLAAVAVEEVVLVAVAVAVVLLIDFDLLTIAILRQEIKGASSE